MLKQENMESFVEVMIKEVEAYQSSKIRHDNSAMEAMANHP